MKDWMEMYDTNARFREYVDAYCRKHEIPPQEAVRHSIVRDVGDMIQTKETEMAKTTTTEIKVGCGGC